MEEIKTTCYKGTRILLGTEKRLLIHELAGMLVNRGFEEIHMPIIQYQATFSGKVGEENNNLMFNFKDNGEREVCLAPEYTAVIQQLAKTQFKYQKDLLLFYVQECFRGEKPQTGRYRQFTQLGVEVINPTKDYSKTLQYLAHNMITRRVSGCNAAWYHDVFTKKLITNTDVTRGLDYYKDGKGFEITYEDLGSQKQICGGGEYDGGIGFAIGIDRLLLIEKVK